MYIVYQCYADMKDKAVDAAKFSLGAFFCTSFSKRWKRWIKIARLYT